MSNGWDTSAAAWIASQGERGDYARQHILDPVMLERVQSRPRKRALDVGCGEGRLCRMMRADGISTVGLEPTAELLEEARRRDPAGTYLSGKAEQLPFEGATFDLVVSYLTLLDIDDFRAALKEMTRVLSPGGTLLISNLSAYITASTKGWQFNADGTHAHYALDTYGEERADWVSWGGIRIRNWHRPLSAYMHELLALDLALTFFDEPMPRSGDPDRNARYVRAPWFLVMEWQKR